MAKKEADDTSQSPQGAEDTAPEGGAQDASKAAEQDATSDAAGGEESGPKTALEAVEETLGIGKDEPEGGETPAEDGAATEGEEAPKKADEKPAGDEKPDDQAAAEGAEDITAIPEGLSERSKARFEKLVEGYKTLTAEHQQVATDYQELRTVIADTGASPTEFTTGLEYMRLVHSENPADLERALNIIESERQAIAVKLGKPLPGMDPLERHADLKQAVELQEISQQHAEELALARERRTREQQAAATRQQHQTTAAQHAAQRTQSLETATAELNRLQGQWQQSDLAYEQKMQLLRPRIEIITRNNLDRLHLVPQLIQQEWEAIGEMMRTIGGTKPPAKGEQPISGGAGAGAALPEPKTTIEAVERALGIS